MTTLHLRKSIGGSPWRRGYLLIAVALCCFRLAPAVQAVSPPPDGGYPGQNTAEGDNALLNLTTGTENTANGNSALSSNTTGIQNTATGANALQNNTTGQDNVATGLQALQFNTTGIVDVATGVNALIFNTTGSYNTATGSATLEMNTIGNENAAHGYGALNANTTGNDNTADGHYALLSNTTGGGNVALGASAGSSLTTGNNNIDIGNAGVAAESNTIRLGTAGTQTVTFVAGIRGVAIAGAQPVAVNASGQLGVRASSARFKEAIKPMGSASAPIFSLHPVTFRYKKELDLKGEPQFGLVAEEVAKVASELVTMDDQGKPLTVRYDEVNAMLLNEFLKEHRTVQGQQREIDALKAELKEQKALIQKVSDKVELNNPLPQMVVNNQ